MISTLYEQANVNEKDGKGRTHLFIAARFNRIDVIQFLLKNNVCFVISMIESVFVLNIWPLTGERAYFCDK